MKPKVFLADLVHNHIPSPYAVPLNIGYLAATLAMKFGNALDVRLFKFPDRLIEELSDKPDILALSNYDWNANLSKAIAKIAKKINPNLFVVMGGPNINGNSREKIREFLIQNLHIDAYVLFEGEEAFAGIIEHFLGNQGLLQDSLVGEGVELRQVAYLTKGDRQLVFGPLCPSSILKDIPHPSAWLSGYLDTFLKCRSFPLFPIFGSTRGCPYGCAYCSAWGATATGIKTIRQFSLDTVFAELKYIFTNVEPGCVQLNFIDSNFGILERDLQIAEEIRRLADHHGKILRVGGSLSKLNMQRNLEICKILGKLCTPKLGQQTFNNDVLSKVCRKGVDYLKVKKFVNAVHENSLDVAVDLLVGLPGENVQRHIMSVKAAFDAGFDKLTIADIRSVPGSKLADDSMRKNYGLKTKYRVIQDAVGIYGGEKVIEYEHCIRGTSDMSEQDFLELRLFHNHISLMNKFGIGRSLLRFAKNHGLHEVDLIKDISRMPPKTEYPLLAKEISDYLMNARDEWFISEKEADSYYMQDAQFNKLLKGEFHKLNYLYAAKIILSEDLCKEFLRWVAYNIKANLPEINTVLMDELILFDNNTVINYPIDLNKSEHLVMSDDGIKEVELDIKNNFLAESRPKHKWLVEFYVTKKNRDNINNMIGRMDNKSGDLHAIESIISFNEKIFLKDIRVIKPV